MGARFIAMVSLTCWFLVAVLSQDVRNENSDENDMLVLETLPKQISVYDFVHQFYPTRMHTFGQTKSNRLRRNEAVGQSRFGIRGDRFIRLGRRRGVNNKCI